MNKLKIVVISDTHIPDRAKALPEKLIEEIKNADMVIHAGDMVSLDFLNGLKSISKCLRAVCGNMDPEEIKKALPQKDIFKAGNFKIGLFHGFGAPNRIFELLDSEFKNDKLDVVIFGHTHQVFNEKRNGALFFNPGSATDKSCVECNTYGVIEINDKIQSRIVNI
ncbi:MAG: metallophosphoesterase family protein [Candidatus Omnitrophica bacterium]|nr:metallophosphoesterase family protein [Candidatus Omnitrophota bacterium]